MKASFGMSLNPADYAWQLVQRLGFRQPPICENTVLDFLQLKKKYFQGSHFFNGESEYAEDISANPYQGLLFDHQQYTQGTPPRRSRSKPVDAALHGSTVWLDSESRNERQRAAICHEVGHYILPGHQGLSYVKDGCIIDLTTSNSAKKHKRYEEEANSFSAHLLMPYPFFREDMNNIPFGIQAVETLAKRYTTSIESTAIHYVNLATFSCALVMIECLPNSILNETNNCLRVRYSKASKSFSHFIQPGAEIAPGTPIARASLMEPGIIHTDEAPGWVLGLHSNKKLILHCRPWGKEGDVLVLVEEPLGNQGRLL